MKVLVQSDPFDPASELSEFTANGAGAVVTFTGVVRDDIGTLQSLEIEHYPAMTQKALRDFAQDAKVKFGLENVLVLHRFGKLAPGEPIMMVATAAKHRKDAFAGADYLMDYLKSRAPFWKKEITQTDSNWVDAKTSDEDALKAWDKGQS